MTIVPAEFDVNHISKSIRNSSGIPILGRITRCLSDITVDNIYYPSDFCYEDIQALTKSEVAAVIVNNDSLYMDYVESSISCPVVLIDADGYIEDGSVVKIGKNGGLRVLFRPLSANNALFVTDACNNYCLMCPQPPKPLVNIGVVDHLLRIIDLIDPSCKPSTIGITGGEPTMIKDGLVTVLKAIRLKFPDVRIELLTNGRFLCYPQYTYELAAVSGKNILVCVPLFGHVASVHDYIVQANGAFDQALDGIIECHRNGLNVEIRIVLHKLTINNLIEISEFIVRNLMFVSHVAFMGMENQGFAKKNWDLLYIDPFDYQEDLLKSVKLMEQSGIHASIYNLPYCVVPSAIRKYCRASISDFKKIYLDSCSSCVKMNECSGLFASNVNKYKLTEKLEPIHHD